MLCGECAGLLCSCGCECTAFDRRTTLDRRIWYRNGHQNSDPVYHPLSSSSTELPHPLCVQLCSCNDPQFFHAQLSLPLYSNIRHRERCQMRERDETPDAPPLLQQRPRSSAAPGTNQELQPDRLNQTPCALAIYCHAMASYARCPSCIQLYRVSRIRSCIACIGFGIGRSCFLVRCALRTGLRSGS